MPPFTLERTDEAIVIKLPLSTTEAELKRILDYFRYVSLGSGSKITQEQIDELAREAKSGWWERNKHRFLGKPGFEGLE